MIITFFEYHENLVGGSSFVVSGSYTIFAEVLSNQKKKKKNSVNTSSMFSQSSRGKLAVSQLPIYIELSGSLYELVIRKRRLLYSPFPYRPLVLSSPSTQIEEPDHNPVCRKYLLLKPWFEEPRAGVTNQPR